MSARKCWACASLLTFAIFYKYYALADVTLTADPLYVKEGGNAILTCNVSVGSYISVYFLTGYTQIFGLANCPDNRTHSTDIFVSCESKEQQFLHLANISKSATWNCSAKAVYSNNVTFFIIVPPKEVVFRVDNKVQNADTTIQKMENSNLTLMCEASAFPKPDIMLKINNMSITTNSTFPKVPENDNISQTILKYPYVFKRSKNKYELYCTAWVLDTEELRSFKVLVDVTYPPDGPPVINSFGNNTLYSVLEQSPVSFVCYIGTSNPAANLTWMTNDTGSGWRNNTINATAVELQGTAFRYHKVRCSCQSLFMGNKHSTVVVDVDVLYPADNVTAHLTVNDGMPKLLDLNFSVTVNANLSITCFANGNPEPLNYSWSGTAKNGSRYLNFMASKTSAGQLACNTFNTMKLSNSTTLIGKGNATYMITVLYPPVVQNMMNQSVIEGLDFHTECNIEQGVVTTQSLRWMSESDDIFSSTNLTFQTVNRTMSGRYTFHLNYTMNPTYGNNTNGKIQTFFYLNVLYKPEDILAKIKLRNGTEENLINAFSVVENETLTLVCSAKGNPEPSHYNWTGIKANNSNVLTFVASREETGSLHCGAFNDMRPTDGNNTTGTESRQYSFSVLYPPDILDFNDQAVLENQTFSTTCNIEHGKTSMQSVIWVSETGSLPSSSILTFQKVDRTRSGFYTCLLNFTLAPTYGAVVTDVKNSSFVLNVLYPPEDVSVSLALGSEFNDDVNQSFSVVEKEDQTLILNCSAGGNPKPKNVTWTGKFSSTSRELKLASSRTYAGGYTCTARNKMFLTDSNNTEVEAEINKTFNIELLYPSDIPSFQDHRVLESQNLSVTCDVKPGKTSTQSVVWVSETGDLPTSSILASSILTLDTVDRTRTGVYTCVVNFTLDPTYGKKVTAIKNSSFFLDVMYPPENIEVSMTMGSKVQHSVTQNFTIVENKSQNVTLNCSSGGHPKPFILWQIVQSGKGVFNITRQSLVLSVTRNSTGRYTCIAMNTINLTSKPQEPEAGKASQVYDISVLYPPELEDLADQNILENTTFTYACVKPGKTTFQEIRWINSSSEVVTVQNIMTIERVKRQDDGNYKCQVNYTLEPDYFDGETDSIQKSFRLQVMFPPENIEVHLSLGKLQTANIGKRFSLIENSTSTLALNCSAKGNPKPIDFSWIGIKSVNSSTIELNVIRDIRGNFTCRVRNTMYLTYKNETTKPGLATETYELDILYPPTLEQNPQENVTEGDLLERDCFTDPGNNRNLTVCWKKNDRLGNGNQTCEKTLFIKNVTKEDEGFYNCTVNFTMIPTIGEEMSLSVHTGFYLYVKPYLNSDSDTETSKFSGGSSTVAIISGVLSAAVVVAIVIVGLAIARKRELLICSRKDEVGKGHAYENVTFTHGGPQPNKRLPALPQAEEEPDFEEDGIVNSTAETDFCNQGDENPYENNPTAADVLKISVSELFTFVSYKSKEYFYEEFEKFPKGLVSTIACTFARKHENLPLNRYQGIYPYDHSRVHISEQPAFFINANYIDGYARRREYIASLGPTERHTLGFQTFWNMVWYEMSDVIVMLTNLTEPSGMKCEQYWPEYGKCMEVECFLIQSKTEEVTGEYTVRTFTVFKGEESRLITQLHYTAWPDKTVPESVTSLIEFRQRVKAVPTRSLGPLVVHCSAGVGRTGTYIALDRLIEEGRSTDYVNVFDCVQSMRKQRVNMVQTPEQYVYLHQALVYCLAFDIEPVTAETIGEYTQTTSNNVFSQLYQQLKQTVEKESGEYIEAQNKHASFIDWNRRRADIPGDRHRVLLSLDKEFGQPNYINAVYVASFLRLDHFIIAQSPLPKTVEDFVGMLYKESSACIVALDDYRQKRTNNAVYLPAENEQFTYGYFSISCLSVEAKPAYVMRKLKLSHDGKHEQGEKVAYHFEFTAWRHDEKLPKDPKMFVEFVREIEDFAKKSTEENPHVVVHCMSGSERSGLFCAVSNLIQKMELEQQVSVVNMLRRVRERRRTAISSMEQLKFCYHAVNAFVKKTQHLSTMKKSFLVHYENNLM